jgi:hypothetical protein
MKGNEGYWGGGISIITQNFPKSLQYFSIHFNPPFPKQALNKARSAAGQAIKSLHPYENTCVDCAEIPSDTA